MPKSRSPPSLLKLRSTTLELLFSELIEWLLDAKQVLEGSDGAGAEEADKGHVVLSCWRNPVSSLGSGFPVPEKLYSRSSKNVQCVTPML